MRHRLIWQYAIVTLVAISVTATAVADQLWAVRGGSTTIEFRQEVLAKHGLSVEFVDGDKIVPVGESVILNISRDSSLSLALMGGPTPEFLGGVVQHEGSIIIRRGKVECVIEQPIFDLLVDNSLNIGLQYRLDGIGGEPGFAMALLKAGVSEGKESLQMKSPDLRISPNLAVALGDKTLSGLNVGRIAFYGDVAWVGGEAPLSEPAARTTAQSAPRGAEPRAYSGCDMRFCRLFDLEQGGREGSIVGLQVGTTSWNVGDDDCLWYDIGTARPEDHPFIVGSLYRLRVVDGSERFEQIGAGQIKHGFTALAQTECGGTCHFNSPHSSGDWLGMGCTDPYSAGLNGAQTNMSPRAEVDAWTGEWTYVESHRHADNHPGGHNGYDHRIAVHDDDLDPNQNQGALYFVEGYYLMPDDVNRMNNAAWHQVTSYTGTVGGQWSFTIPDDGEVNVGFAIDAWAGAQQTIIAQELPIVPHTEPNASPDGRAVLAVKTTDLGNGMWHYEYALLNVDMERKISSFSVPVSDGTIIRNIEFHCPMSPEVFDAIQPWHEIISDDPWIGEFANGYVTWKTDDTGPSGHPNPIGWNMQYAFRFDANVEPDAEQYEVVLGLHEPGTPEMVTGLTTVPTQGPPDCNENGIPDPCDIDCGNLEYDCPSYAPNCGGSLNCNGNEIPDECEPDCNGNGVADECDLPPLGTVDTDCNANGVPDACEPDCNGNGIADECDVVPIGAMADCNGNLTPDICEEDCNGNGIADECDVVPIGTGIDCNANLVPDECEPFYICGNNYCSRAMTVWAGPDVMHPAEYEGSTIGALADGSAGEGTCATASTAPDMWYSYTPSESGLLTISTCVGSAFDTYLSIHTGCPGTEENELACDDDGCGVGGRSEIADFPVVADQTYLIRVSSWSPSITGDFRLSIVGPPTSVDPVRGGRIWDKYWQTVAAPTPYGQHSLYPASGQQTGSATFRCTECHGWDFKGADGAYSSGPHYTGIPGVLGSTMSAADMFAMLREDENAIENGHGYRYLGMTDDDIWDVVAFIKTHVVDMSAFIDANGEFIGSATTGETLYTNGPTTVACYICHDGTGTAYRGTRSLLSGVDYTWLGRLAVDDPWQFFHKVRFGDTNNTYMPVWMRQVGDDQGLADIGAFAQSTAFAYDCTESIPCTGSGGPPCAGAGACVDGRCVAAHDGDMDGNGVTDGLDLQMFVDAIVNSSSDAEHVSHCDFSDNGVVDADDIDCMLEFLLN